VGTEEHLEPTLAPEQARATPNVWGPWATIGLSVVAFIVSLLSGAVIALVVLAVLGELTMSTFLFDPDSLESDSLFLLVASVLWTAVLVGCLAGFIWFRRTTLREYLHLRLPSRRVAIAWMVACLALLAAMDCVTVFALGRDIVPPSQVEDYRNAESLVALLLAVVVVAPVSEELLFRGFLFKGIASKWGGPAAIMISAVLWASLHLQYDLYGIFQVFVSGIFLGVVRLRSGSVLLVIALHAMGNLISSIETAILIAGTP